MKTVLDGLLIFAKYDPDNNGGMYAEHDEIFVECPDLDPSNISKDDLAGLEANHWDWDGDGWHKFV